MGDELNKLPSTRGVSHDDPSHIQLLSNIFGNEKAMAINTVCSSNKDIMIAGMLFLVVNLPPLTSMISGIYKNAENPWIMVLVKTILFTILLFLILNSKFAKK